MRYPPAIEALVQSAMVMSVDLQERVSVIHAAALDTSVAEEANAARVVIRALRGELKDALDKIDEAEVQIGDHYVKCLTREADGRSESQ